MATGGDGGARPPATSGVSGLTRQMSPDGLTSVTGHGWRLFNLHDSSPPMLLRNGKMRRMMHAAFATLVMYYEQRFTAKPIEMPLIIHKPVKGLTIGPETAEELQMVHKPVELVPQKTVERPNVILKTLKVPPIVHKPWSRYRRGLSSTSTTCP